MAKTIKITDDGLKKLQQELETLKTEGRADIAEKIKVARGYGDLSENSEYDEAKNEQAKLEARIVEIEAMLKNVEIIEDIKGKAKTVIIGVKVKVEDLEYGDIDEYRVVGSTEADSREGKISDESPMGKALLGKKIGDEFDVNVTFPEEYHAKDLAGKAAVFAVKVNGIKKKEYPELDDEFAKDISEFDTFEELKNATKERLEKNAENRTKREQEEAVIDAVLAKTKVELPEVMITNQIEQYVQDAKYRIESQMPGITFEQYLEYTGGNLDDFKEGMKERAEKDVRISLMLDAVAKAENIEVSDEDIDAEIKKIAEQYKMEEEKVRELINADQVKESILPGKVVDFLVENVKIS